jgi:hypothetical protein
MDSRTEEMAKPRGKYSHLIGSLPVLLNSDANQQERVDALKKLFRVDPELSDTASYARLYEDARQRKQAAEALLKSIEDEIEAVTQLLADRFDNEGLGSIKLENGTNISIWHEPYAQVEDKERFRQWCLRNGLERSLALPWQTMNSLTKERLLLGDPEPDGVTCFSKVKIRYAGGGKEEA